MKITNMPHEVFGHCLPGASEWFHIGSGRPGRAYRQPRTVLWTEYLEANGRRYEVHILEVHRCPARARLREMELVRQHRPPTNIVGVRTPIPAKILDGTLKGRQERCRCGAPDCYGAELDGRN